MRYRRTAAAGSVAFFLLAGVPAPAFAQSEQTGALSVTQPWTRATPPKARTAGGFLTIENAGEEPDRLVGATSPIAGMVEIHEMRMDDGVMIMRPAEGGIEIPVGGTATLAPGGTHIMFMQLNEALVEGDTIPVTLTFQVAGDLEVLFPVEAIGARGPASSNDHGGHAPGTATQTGDQQSNAPHGSHMHGHGP